MLDLLDDITHGAHAAAAEARHKHQQRLEQLGIDWDVPYLPGWLGARFYPDVSDWLTETMKGHGHEGGW